MNQDKANEPARVYRDTLLGDVIPFWLFHGLNKEYGGYLTALDRDGAVLDTDKSVWFQGRGAWMFATLFNTVARKEEWLAAARSGIEFLRHRCAGPNGKLYFIVTRQGEPLRMRRYVYSEAFAAIANAAFARAAGDERAADDARRFFETYVRHSFTPGLMDPKVIPATRRIQGIGAHMIAIAAAQELRANLGDVPVAGQSCTEWIDRCIGAMEQDFMKPELQAVMKITGPDGAIIDHFDGRTLNPGHALEAAWFILHEARLRNDTRLRLTGCAILDWMWQRGWDPEYGGIFYFRDLRELPVQEYWHDMTSRLYEFLCDIQQTCFVCSRS